MRRRIGAGVMLAAWLSGGVAAGCGAGSDCALGDRIYRLRMPAGLTAADTPVGAILYLHGVRGSAAGVMASGALEAQAQALGVALIAAEAVDGRWATPNGPSGAPDVDDLAYLEAVADDAAARFAIDRGRIVVAGFSAGAMMVWTLACRRGDRFAGFAPVAGVFWRPIPEGCDGEAASVVHLHGDRDRTVPLEGRRVRDAMQGDVRETIAMYARHGGFGAREPHLVDGLGCERRQNAAGRLLMFCRFMGGHRLEPAHLGFAWRALMGAASDRTRAAVDIGEQKW